jgi:2-polyprenyl-3-methyl-5-hydroxy-6-metoxy-1,4-benzoquinol methylase
MIPGPGPFESCPICEGTTLGPSIAPPGLVIARCRACGHRAAIHEGRSGPDIDYHEQYDNDAFLEALRATRVRQAGRLIECLRRHVPSLSGIVDYGAGRGWFLNACRSAGVAPVAGVDTSRVSVDGLKASGIEAHLLPEEEAGADVLSQLSFRPRVVCFLDVLEHFPPDRIQERFRSLLSGCGKELEIVVVKVPVAGLLYGAATLLARIGAPNILRQLYQVGTWPPHFNYFSPTSAERLLASAGLSVVERVGDPDFEPELLGRRIGAASPSARTLARIGGESLGAVIRLTGRFDSAIFLARPIRSH